MPAQSPTDRRERLESHAGFNFRVTSYQLGDTFHAAADNVDPGAIIARAAADTREDAERAVIEAARRRLARTRRQSSD